MTKADILAGLRKQPVPFEVAGLSLFLKPWTVATRMEFAVWRKANPGATPDLLVKLFTLSACDESGVLLFADANPADLADLDGAAIEAVAARVVELNGIGSDDPKAR